MKIAKALLPLAPVVVVLATACADSESESTPDSQNSELGVELTLEVPATAQIGETVPLLLTMKNVTADHIKIRGGGIPSHDFVVSDETGRVVWFWRTGVDDAIPAVQLDPGEEEELAGSWTPANEVQPGDYRVKGLFHLADDGALETESARITLIE